MTEKIKKEFHFRIDPYGREQRNLIGFRHEDGVSQIKSP
jgi:hypothetical protein